MGGKCCACMSPKHLQYFGLLFLSIAALLSTLSLVMPYWRTGDSDEGLYYYVKGGSNHQLTDIIYGEEGWWRFCQVMHPILTLAAVTSAGLGWLYTIQRYNGETSATKLPDISFVLALVSGILWVSVQLAYNHGVFRKDKGFKKHFCYYVLHALTPLLIVGGVWFRQSYVYMSRGCGRDQKPACGF